MEKERDYFKQKYDEMLKENKELIQLRDSSKRKVEETIAGTKDQIAASLALLQKERDEFKNRLEIIDREKETSAKRELFVKHAKALGLSDEAAASLNMIAVDLNQIDLKQDITAELLARDLQQKMPFLFNGKTKLPSPGKLNTGGSVQALLDEALDKGDVETFLKLTNE